VSRGRFYVAAVLSAVLSGSLLAFPSPAGASVKCLGKRATIVSNRSVIRGTRHADVIRAGRGANEIVARGGADLICAGAGRDRISGGAGSDIIMGGRGADHASGGRGLDAVAGGPGADVMSGGRGALDIVAFVNASAGVEASLASHHATGEGNDQLTAFEVIMGSDARDILTGNASDNMLYGLNGNDHVDGGDGFDYVGYLRTDAPVSADLNSGFSLGEGNDLLFNVEGLIGTQADDQLFGDTGNNALIGWGGNDILQGGDGNDLLAGLNGNDELAGEEGTDLLVGGKGNDSMDGGAGVDVATWLWSAASVNADLATGQAGSPSDGSDSLSQIEELQGSSAGDVLVGDGAANGLFGGAGGDQLAGQGGDDYIDGAQGNDTIDGGSGDDLCISGNASNCEQVSQGSEPPGLPGGAVTRAAKAATRVGLESDIKRPPPPPPGLSLNSTDNHQQISPRERQSLSVTVIITQPTDCASNPTRIVTTMPKGFPVLNLSPGTDEQWIWFRISSYVGGNTSPSSTSHWYWTYVNESSNPFTSFSWVDYPTSTLSDWQLTFFTNRNYAWHLEGDVWWENRAGQFFEYHHVWPTHRDYGGAASRYCSPLPVQYSNANMFYSNYLLPPNAALFQPLPRIAFEP
jgi:Ca2+-binding RTX toxin-like protein